MYYTYVLISAVKDVIYVGYTADLKQRLFEHNNSIDNNFTKKYRPWKLLYYEAYLSKKDAQNRERKLKYRGRAKALLKQRLSHSYHEIRKVLGDVTIGIRGC